jgi:hypothetical protein
MAQWQRFLPTARHYTLGTAKDHLAGFAVVLTWATRNGGSVRRLSDITREVGIGFDVLRDFIWWRNRVAREAQNATSMSRWMAAALRRPLAPSAP